MRLMEELDICPREQVWWWQYEKDERVGRPAHQSLRPPVRGVENSTGSWGFSSIMTAKMALQPIVKKSASLAVFVG